MEFLRSVLALCLLFFACTTVTDDKKSQNVLVQKPMIVKKPSSSFEDTAMIKERSAVFFKSDSLQLEKMKTVYEKAVYDTKVHDCFYMMQNARNVISKYWPGLHTIEVNKVRYLLFVKKDKNFKCIDLNTKNDICGMFLFDPEKDPEQVDMPNVDTFMGFYFGLKTNTRK